MSRKILFVDLDGTLLRDDKSISPENLEAIRAALDAGHYLVLATGRAVSSGRNIARELGLTVPGCYLIAYNGAVIYDFAADCVLESKRLPIQYAEYLYYEAKKAGLYIQTYNATQVLSETRSKEFELYIKRTQMQYRIEKDPWALIDEEPPKMLLISLDGKEKLEKFKKAHDKWAKDKCSCFFSSEEYLEYCPLGATKGFGVTFLCEFLSVARENTVAIGDQENDISMLQEAYVGVAMANAIPKVKKIADYVTIHNNEENGVAEVIEKYVLR